MKNIEKLLEKYFDGETSLDEEKFLREFFESKDIPEDMIVFKDMFKALDKLGEEKTFAAYSLEKAEIEEMTRKSKKISLWLKITSAAAAAVVVFVIWTAFFMPGSEYDFVDKYPDAVVSDTTEARRIIKDALNAVSSNINYGAEKASEIKKIDKTIQKAKRFSKIEEYNKIFNNTGG